VRGTVVDAATTAAGDSAVAVDDGRRIRLRRWRPSGRLTRTVPGLPASVPLRWRPSFGPERDDLRVVLLWSADPGTVLLIGPDLPPAGARSLDSWVRARLRPGRRPECPSRDAVSAGRWTLSGWTMRQIGTAPVAARICDRPRRTSLALDQPNSTGRLQLTARSTPVAILADFGVVLRHRQLPRGSFFDSAVEILDLEHRRRLRTLASPLVPLRTTPDAFSSIATAGPAAVRVADAPCAQGARSATLRGGATEGDAPLVVLGDGYLAWLQAPTQEHPGRAWLADAAGVRPLDDATSLSDAASTAELVAGPGLLTLHDRSGGRRAVRPVPAAPQSWPMAEACS
jgi:hypothetical protein